MKPVYAKWCPPVLWMMVFLLCSVYPAAADSPLNIYVVNYPLKYFAERIGGTHVKVTLPVPAGEDPVYWTPEITDIDAYQQADLILLNGAGYAKWVSKVSLPRSKTVNTSRGFKGKYITVEETMNHSHGAGGKHAHEGLAFTTWLDFSLAARQAESVYKGLVKKRPDRASQFEANYMSLEKDLLSLDKRLKAVASRNNTIQVIFSHPVYEYLEKAYSLNGRSVHWEPDQDPTPGQIDELENLKGIQPALWMIWEGTPIKSAVDALEAMGIQSSVFNPCGNVPSEGDFLSVMQHNVTNIETVFR